MSNPKEKVEDSILSEYWGMFVEGIVGGILTFYLISLGGLASLCGFLILAGEIGTIIYSVNQGEFRFLIVFLLTNWAGGSNGK